MSKVLTLVGGVEGGWVSVCRARRSEGDFIGRLYTGHFGVAPCQLGLNAFGFRVM